MRLLQLLALVGAIAVAAVVLRDYWAARERRAIEVGEVPAAIAEDVASQATGWSWSQTAGSRQRVSITAAGFSQDRSRAGISLADVRLEIQHPESGVYDRVTTDRAFFEAAENKLSSDGEVVITLGLPAGEPPTDESPYTRIIAARAAFNTETGGISTDEDVVYEFDGGVGRSKGAHYDSLSRRFTMDRDAVIERHPSSTARPTAVIRAGRLDYFELDEKILLTAGAELDRGRHHIKAERAEVQLKDGAVQLVRATNALGVSRNADRETHFEAPQLTAWYSPEGWIRRVTGDNGSRLTSLSRSSRLIAQAKNIDLEYKAEPGETDSRLTEAILVENASIEALPASTNQSFDERRVEAPRIHLKMRPGGQEVAYLETSERGRMLLSPYETGASGRSLVGDRLRVDYGSRNQMEQIVAHGGVELTESPSKGNRAPLRSWSDDLKARFEPTTGELASLEQTGETRVEQGRNKGMAEKAVYEPAPGRLTLTGNARVDQPDLAIAADRIQLTETAGFLHALGRVAAEYHESAPTGATTGMFQPGRPVFAAAERMTSDQNSGRVEYRGDARLWQGQSRIDASRITIDRKAKSLEAEGAVSSVLRDEGSQTTVVLAERLLYREDRREANYSGAVVLSRGALRVQADQLDAYLSEGDGADFERAAARGRVEITQLGTGRKGFGESVRYTTSDETAVLEGAPARAVNQRGEETRGARLTYRIDSEDLLVEGAAEPALAIQRRARD